MVPLLISAASPMTTPDPSTSTPLSESTPLIESVTLSEGSTGTLTLSIQGLNFIKLRLTSDPSVTIRFQSSQHAFFVLDHGFYPHGFKAPNQLERFKIEMSYKTDSSLTVSVIIHNVSAVDAGEYKFYVYINPDGRYISATKIVHVQSQTSQSSCYVTASAVSSYLLEVHCRAETGRRNAAISCFQNNNTLPINDVFEGENVVESAFLINCTGHVCCSFHELHEIVDQESCQDFTWVPTTEVNCQTNRNEVCGHEKNTAAKSHFSNKTNLIFFCILFVVFTLKNVIV